MTPKELVERLNTVREGMEAGLDDWPIASQIWEYKEAATAIEQLTARVAELEEENAWLNAESRDACLGLSDYYSRKLATEQLNNKLLRDALEAVIKVHGYESGIPVEALSTQASTEALDKYVAEKVKEAGKFDMWKINPYTKVLETSIKQLTKQRDLAVEAMREALECGEDGDWQSARRIFASAIKESEK